MKNFFLKITLLMLIVLSTFTACQKESLIEQEAYTDLKTEQESSTNRSKRAIQNNLKAPGICVSNITVEPPKPSGEMSSFLCYKVTFTLDRFHDVTESIYIGYKHDSGNFNWIGIANRIDETNIFEMNVCYEDVPPSWLVTGCFWLSYDGMQSNSNIPEPNLDGNCQNPYCL